MSISYYVRDKKQLKTPNTLVNYGGNDTTTNTTMYHGLLIPMSSHMTRNTI
jgi:hypothetical protein